MFKLDLEKADEPEIKFPTSIGSLKKQENSRKTSTSALLTTPKPLTVVDLNKLWKIVKEMGISDHLTCPLRNLYAGQEATVRMRRGTTDFPNWERRPSRLFLSHCSFNFYAEYIMRNALLDEAQAGIKITRRNIITSDTQMTPLLCQKAKN